MFKSSSKLAGLFVFLGSSASALAEGWTICNRTPETLNVAIAYFGKSEKFVSEGWWALQPCGGCTQVMNHSKTERVNVYYRAVSAGGDQRIGGDTNFCVTTQAKGSPPFTISGEKDCARRGFVAQGFQLQALQGTNQFTTNITGKVAGKVCRG